MLPEVKDETASWSAEQLYKDAHESLLDGQLYAGDQAVRDARRRAFPTAATRSRRFSKAPTRTIAQGESATAIAACDRFIRTYPNHPNVDYAYYLKGLVNFREDQGLFGYVYETRPVRARSEDDAGVVRARSRSWSTRFPDSKYAEDSAERMRYLTNALGMYEVHVARYYYNRGAYIAAVNRAQAALVNYPQTPANEDALDAAGAKATTSSADAACATTRAASWRRPSRNGKYFAGVPTSRGGNSGRKERTAAAAARAPPPPSRGGSSGDAATAASARVCRLAARRAGVAREKRVDVGELARAPHRRQACQMRRP